jgi:CoA-transferase family III
VTHEDVRILLALAQWAISASLAGDRGELSASRAVPVQLGGSEVIALGARNEKSRTGANHVKPFELVGRLEVLRRDHDRATFLDSGVLTALLRRHKAGKGSSIEVTLLEALREWMGYPAYYAGTEVEPRRAGTRHAIIAPHGDVETGDGVVV